MSKSKPKKREARHRGEPIPPMVVQPVKKVKRPKDKLRAEIMDEMIRRGD